MHRRSAHFSIALSIALIVCFGGLAGAQSASGDNNAGRKISARVQPVYPELAKKMHIHGAVRVEAVVRSNGTVKSTRVLGGNPVLGEAAEDAVAKWKFEPAQNETTEVVQLAFESQQQ
jgi:TonB family protein